MGEDIVGTPGAIVLDPSHVTFDVTALGTTGFAAAGWRRHLHRIHLELSGHRRLMPLVGFAHTEANIDRLVAALTAPVEAHSEADQGQIPDVPHPSSLRTETVMPPREAFLGKTEMVEWWQAVGRVSAETIYPYPPGIPITSPGERLTAQMVDYLQQLAAASLMVEGAADESLARIRVSDERNATSSLRQDSGP